MATKISAYSENNRFFLCFEDCDPDTAKKIGDFVLNVLKVPISQTEGFVVEKSQVVAEKSPLDFPVLGTSGTLDVAIRRKDTVSIVNTLVNNKNIPADTLKEIKIYLNDYLCDIEKHLAFYSSGEALIHIQNITPLCKKAIFEYLETISPEQKYKSLADYYASNIKNAHILLLKYLINNLKQRISL